MKPAQFMKTNIHRAKTQEPKYRLVEAKDSGPYFSEWQSLEEVTSLLLSWGRGGLKLKTDSVWKKVRGKWVPAFPYQFKGTQV